MANTVTQRTVFGGGSSRKVVRLINIVSDGSEETDLVIYDNSTLVNDVLKGAVRRVEAWGNSCTCRLEWDQTTDSPVVSFDPVNNPKVDFSKFGDVNNPGGAGATGDLVLTTANLDSGDEVTILIEIIQS